MSSHMLDDEEFQVIADWIYMQGISRQSRHRYCVRTFLGFVPGSDKHHNVDDEEVQQTVKNVIRNFYNLNRLALTTRYGLAYDREDEKHFTPTYNPMANERKVIDRLQSLRYQCAEYIVCETKWYDELRIFIGQLCENIFMRNE